MRTRNAAVLLMVLAAAVQAAAGESFLPRLAAQFESASREGRYPQAVALGEGTLWLSNRVFKQPSSASMETTRLLAEAHAGQRNYAKAQYLYERLLGAPSNVKSAEGDVLIRLGDLQALQGRVEQADAFYTSGLDVHMKTLPQRDPRLTNEMIQIGNFYTSVGKGAKAEKLYLGAFDIRRQVFGEQDPAVSEASLALADFYETRGAVDKAEQFYRLAASSQELSGGKDRSAAITAILLARFYEQNGRADAAGRSYARGAVSLARSFGMSARDLPLFESEAGGDLEHLQRQFLREAKENAGPMAIAEALRNEAEAYLQLDMPTQARRAIQQSANAYERALGPGHPDLPGIFSEHAAMLRQIGDKRNADELEQRAAQAVPLTR